MSANKRRRTKIAVACRFYQRNASKSSTLLDSPTQHHPAPDIWQAEKNLQTCTIFRFLKRDRYTNKLQYDNWSSKLSYYPIIHNINFNFWVVWWDKGNWNIIHQFAAMPQATYYVQGNREFRQGLNTNVTIVDVSDLFQILILPKRDPIVQIQVSNLFNWLRSMYVRIYVCKWWKCMIGM